MLFRTVSLFLLLLISFQNHAATITLNSANNSEGGDSTFVAELLLGAKSPTVGVILLHGRGGNPDSAVVRQLRNSLNNAGYTTLSIQEPLPAGGSDPFQNYVDDLDNLNYVFPETQARIRESINHLETLGVEKIVVLGFSLGSRLAAAHVARGQIDELPIIGLIGIGMYATSIDPLNHSSTLDEVTVPVLDLYGDDDTNAVNTALARSNAYNSGTGTSYTQLTLDCAVGLTTNDCHKLVGLKGSDSAALETTVRTWMNTHAPLPGAGSTPPADSGGGSSLSPFILLTGIFLPIFFARRQKR